MTNFLLFGKFMVEHGAWESYKRQYRASPFRREYGSPFWDYVVMGANPTWFLECSFNWEISEEGDVYWMDLLTKWDNLLYEQSKNS